MHSKSQKGKVHVARVTWKTTVNINTTEWGQNGRLGVVGVLFSNYQAELTFNSPIFREMGRCVNVCQCTHMYI